MSEFYSRNRRPILEIFPSTKQNALGKIIGVACAPTDEDWWFFTDLDNTVWADLAVKDQMLWFVCRTDDGPHPPRLPEGFERPPNVSLSSKGNAALGFLRANAFLEEAITTIQSKVPSRTVERQRDRRIFSLWPATLHRLSDTLPLYVTLPQYENPHDLEKVWKAIFAFHYYAVSMAIKDLSGKMTTTLTSKLDD